MYARHWEVASRNIFKNRTRSLLSLLVVAASSISIIVFWGFSEKSLEFMRQVVADQQYGHLQIATKEFWNPKSTERKDSLLLNYQKITDDLSKIKNIVSVSGRVNFPGLISTGNDTTSAQFVGIAPDKEPQFRESLTIKSGDYFSSPNADEILISPHFSKSLGVKVGEKITVVANSVDGIINARELKIVGIYSTSIEEIDKYTFYVPLFQAQKILDTDAYDILIIRLNSMLEANSTKQIIQEQILNNYPETQIKTWYELGTLYRQVESFYGLQNTVVQLILGLILILGIGNIIGINIHERTGEIGTIRSLGETRGSIIQIFSIESFLIGLIGSIIGAIAGTLIIIILNHLQIMTDMPGASEPVPILFKYSARAYYISFITNITLTVLASLWPAYRGSKIQIVDALRKNI